MSNETTYTKINGDTLPAPLKAKLATLHKAFEAVKVARAAFEPELIALYVANKGAPPAGMEYAVMHQYGLTVATRPVKSKSSGSSKAVSLTA